MKVFINKVLSIRVKDVSIFDDFMNVYLVKRKNYQYKDGHISVIARSWKLTCPVMITEKLLPLLPDSKDSSNPIVCRIVNSSLWVLVIPQLLLDVSPTFPPLFLMPVSMVLTALGLAGPTTLVSGL